MTSRNALLTEATIGRLLQAAARYAITEGAARARTPKVLSGTVEDMNAEELDVVWLRVDTDALGGDPSQSMNYEAPGIIPGTRLGETFTEEQVRITFDGPAGASAMRTGAETKIVLPFGAEIGSRIEIEGGDPGEFRFYDDDDDLVGLLDPTQWSLGKPGESLVRIDPFGGVRLRDAADALRAQLSAVEGLILKNASGISGLIANHDGMIVLDPSTGERISITSGTTSATPTPHVQGTAAATSGANAVAPAVTVFGADDIDIRFASWSDNTELGAATSTPPGSYTEQTDVSSSNNGLSLATSSATRDPAQAAPGAQTFVSSLSGWTRRNTYSVIVNGGGATSPTIRAAASGAVLTTNARSFDYTVPYPTGTVAGDMVLAFVTMCGPFVPVGWTIPDGWKQLGVQVAGLGTPHVLASGIWYGIAPASPPASEDVAINMSGSGVMKIHATTVAIANPYAYPAGLDIRLNNRSMPRGLVKETVETDITTNWTNAQLPQSVNPVSDVELKAGRSYRVEFNCPAYEFAAIDTNCRWEINIQRDAGSGFATPTGGLVKHIKPNAGGTSRDSIYGAFTYTPATDETSDWRATISNLQASGGYNIQLRSGAGASQRSLSIYDVGAEF